jgi:hypothetical protein
MLRGPAVRRKRVFVELAVSGLASMYPASDWSVLRFGPESALTRFLLGLLRCRDRGAKRQSRARPRLF